jgi:WS/DGAT/MGAT family acyltransferase
VFDFAPPNNLKQRLTSQDASFLYAESNTGPLHIGSLGLFEGEIPFAKLVRHIEQRLHLIPRYRQRLGFVPLNLNHATWEDDPNFKIENHIKRHKLSKGADEAAMIKAAMRIYQRPLDRNRPLWEMHSLEGLEGRTATVWKVHHCMVDGVSGVELTTVILDFYRDAPAPKPPEKAWKPAPFPTALDRLTRALRENIRADLQLARQAANLLAAPQEVSANAGRMVAAARQMGSMLARPIAATPWNSRLVTQARRMAWCRYPFASFRAIRGALGGTINDVVLTILTEAAARYLKHHGYRSEGANFRIGCPVNVRHDDERAALGNRVSMMFPELPASPMNPVARLAATMQETNRIKAEHAPQVLENLINAADLFAPSLINLAARAATFSIDAAASMTALIPPRSGPSRLGVPGFGINFVATNVPGVQVPQYIAGHECTDSVGLVPLGATLGYGVAITSYNQKLYFGLTAEPVVMPDVELMKNLIDQVYTELEAAAASVAAVQETEPPKRKKKVAGQATAPNGAPASAATPGKPAHATE